MITAAQIRKGGNYLHVHLRRNDYYSEGEAVDGLWFGKGAEKLGLSGPVEDEQFHALRGNRHPETGEKLTPRDRKPYEALNPKTGRMETRHPVAFHDIQISAPKAVSIVAVLGEDDRVREAFVQSVTDTLGRLEKHAAVRVRDGENAHTENFRYTKNMAAAVFCHDSSRHLDPQLHAHAVVSNVTYDPERQRWYALQPRQMLEASRQINVEMRRALKQRLEDLGYRVKLDKESFSIEGIGKELERRFSQRAQERDAFRERYKDLFGEEPGKDRVEQFIKETKDAATHTFTTEFAAKFDRPPSKEEIENFVKDPRRQKLHRTSTAEVREQQAARLEEGELETIRNVVANANRQPLKRARLRSYKTARLFRKKMARSKSKPVFDLETRRRFRKALMVSRLSPGATHSKSLVWEMTKAGLKKKSGHRL